MNRQTSVVGKQASAKNQAAIQTAAVSANWPDQVLLRDLGLARGPRPAL